MDGKTKAINYASIIFGFVIGATVGWIIYQRTMSRAKQLEAEALEAGTAEGAVLAAEGMGYRDENVDGDAVALMVDDDDISLWDNDGSRDAMYHDEFTDDDDVFASGDLEEEPRRTNPPKK